MQQQNTRVNIVTLLTIAGLLIWGFLKSGSVMIGGEIQLIPAVLGILICAAIFRIIGEIMFSLAHSLDRKALYTPTGKGGTARWAKYKDYKHELCKQDAGPFWGIDAHSGKKLFIDLVSNATIIGPTGSGKGHTFVVNLIFLLPFSKVIMDFKPELLAICKSGLEKLGQQVIQIDPFGVHKDRTGETYQLNFLDITTDNLFTTGGLKHVFTDADEFTEQLCPHPPNQQGDSKFWNNGSQKILSFAKTSECMMNGYDGTMENVALLLSDQTALELRLCSIVGENIDGSPDPQGEFLFELSEWADFHNDDDLSRFLKTFRARAAGLLQQLRHSEKQFQSFLEGAVQAVKDYGYGELSSAMGKTNFDVNALKNGDQIVNLFIVGDSSRQKKTEKFFGDTQWFIQTKLKRHPNKDVRVGFINDEINNYFIHGYISLLSWCRGFGITTFNILQNVVAFGEKHGKHAVNVLFSESEVKLFLAGQRCPETIDKMVKMLGEQSVMGANLGVSKNRDGLQESTSESGRKLLKGDEINRIPYGILFVRDNYPILQQSVSYSEISPLRKLADINPFHGKPFLRKVKLKLKLPKLRKPL